MTDCEKEGERVSGRWTKLEHEQFILGIALFM